MATAYDYYQLLPSINHSSGDLWQNIPIKSLNRHESVDAIVVTPACDLAQCKTEVINFIPIISVSDFFLSKAFWFEAWNSVRSSFDSVGSIKPMSRFSYPKIEDITAAIELLSDGKDQTKLSKCISYLEYVNYISGKSDKKPKVDILLGMANYNKILDSIIRNNYRNDIHFLPASRLNGQNGLNCHSVALFRYIFSIDISILDQAQRVNPDDWRAFKTSMEVENSGFSDFTSYPVKICKLKDDFLSELLARNLNMYMRFGSRDFSAETINVFRSQII